jgi:hypothetical protein
VSRDAQPHRAVVGRPPPRTKDGPCITKKSKKKVLID